MIEAAPILNLILQIMPPDGGPIYAETDLTRTIAEPFNALSSLLIAAPGVYWAIRLRGQYREYAFLTFCLPLLFLGGIGSALYHAFRSSGLLLIMDVLPPALLTLMVGVFFWKKVLAKWWFVVLVVIPFLLLRVLIFDLLPEHAAINASYFITGTMIFLPLLIILNRQHFFGLRPILISVVMLSLSLLFREMDLYGIDLLPMGTHFLWHIFSGIGALYLGQYLYLERSYEISKE